ncbi:MAG: DUF1499 domain-containing protein [Gammaproteobacteria bacterium]
MNQPPSAGSSQLIHWAPRAVLLGMIIGIIAILAVLLPGPLYRLGAYGLGGAFTMIKYGAFTGIAAVIISLIGLILLLVAKRPQYFVGVLIGIVLGILAWGIPYMWLKKAQSVPAIHDITTDTANPPQFQPDVLAQRTETHARNSAVYGGAKIAAKQEVAYPDIKPMVFKLPVVKVFDATLQTAKAMGWKLDSKDPATGIIEATDTTFWFGFTDDVVIRIQAQGSDTRLDIRSESRIGESDVGKNAQRIRTFRTTLYKQFGLQYPPQ